MGPAGIFASNFIFNVVLFLDGLKWGAKLSGKQVATSFIVFSGLEFMVRKTALILKYVFEVYQQIGK